MTTIKLYADEHVGRPIVNNLRNKGIDIISTEEAGNKGKSDEEQLEFACANSRAVLTMDSDYLLLREPSSHYGIFFISKRKPDREIVSRIMELIELLDQKEAMGIVVYV